MLHGGADRLRLGPVVARPACRSGSGSTVLFAVNLWLLARERLDATIASALVVGAVNIVLILALSAHRAQPRARRELRPGQGAAARRSPGRHARCSALIFGVVLLAFFGHTSAANSAKVVLERDPSGRALLRGNVAALGVADRSLRAHRARVRRRARPRRARRQPRAPRSSRSPTRGGVAVECSARCSPCWRSAWAPSTPRSASTTRWSSGARSATACGASLVGAAPPGRPVRARAVADRHRPRVVHRAARLRRGAHRPAARRRDADGAGRREPPPRRAVPPHGAGADRTSRGGRRASPACSCRRRSSTGS